MAIAKILFNSISSNAISSNVASNSANTLVTTPAAKSYSDIVANSKNYIVNPGMRISQENGTASGTVSGYYPVDQWVHSHSQDGTLTAQQVASATPGGSTHRIRMTVTTADASLAAGQYALFNHFLEGLRAADLLWGTASAKDVVVRFGFKGPAGTYAVAIRNQDFNRSYVREFTISGGEANTDTVQTLTFPGDTSGTWDTDNTLSMALTIVLATGSTYQTTADAWQSGNYLGTSSTTNGIGTVSSVFELFDVGMYVDPDSTGIAPPFILPNYDEDLRECQRYYIYLNVQALLQFISSSGGGYSGRNFPVTMRTTPSVTITGEVGSGAALIVSSTGYYQSTNHSQDSECVLLFNARM
jgi:hypothetical protein